MEESVYKPLGSDRQYIEYPPKETDEESDDGLGERTFRNLRYEQLRGNPRQPPRLDPFPSSRSTAFPSRSAGFDIIVQGVLEGAECHEADVLFARTYWVYGPDWTTHNSLSGGDTRLGEVPLVRSLGQQCQSEVVTQLSVVSADPFSRFTWSAPFECSLRSTNPHGWPQLVVTLHTVKGAIPQRSKASEDQTSGSRSGEQCVSYSRCFIPMQNGMHRKRLPLLQLRPSTTKQSFISWLTGQRPELRDPMFLCTGEDRCVLTAAPLTGHVSLTLSVTISGLRECGIGT
ncbi:hypothetical protein, conserved [Trypanosoma brucei gambiense DAL972]|uniref:B9 domain-containing protein 1 n=1 Tax=Trypanosoma brucei gambiense (strain MHOM/CI/86/DAL972) TaxID=679716 RepID=D0A095_TRYB9|nr:hypothetical protein, conserved [Trypanosoma brucei gambiense DAL972]CBH16653.1 hypothetical protein, conserved [Trypanosoma brucei gambiense DAL972]|eukprot:XP_011778917.1 hypothetical protein, conserved [Trypanosoma brucei gambiense DAL972]